MFFKAIYSLVTDPLFTLSCAIAYPLYGRNVFLNLALGSIISLRALYKVASLDSEIRDSKRWKVIIAGSGFAGLCAAKRLLDVGIEDIIILERDDDVGGTWKVNTYPGVACDVQSHLYSFSFFPNPKWTLSYSKGKEILQYIHDFVDHFKLRKYIKFGHRITECHWNEQKSLWVIKTENGKQFEANFFIHGAGGLVSPHYPNFKGMKSYENPMYHTAEWKEDINLNNKVVGVIGTGASAVQVVPTILDQVKKLYLFQRTAAWVPKRSLIQYSGFIKKCFEYFPLTRELLRMYIYFFNEIVFFIGFDMRSPFRNILSKMITKEIKHELGDDPDLWKKVIPEFEMGCKRITPSHNYLKALASDKVKIVQDKIEGFTKKGIETSEENIDLDAVILATGYDILKSIRNSYQCYGIGGEWLQEKWGDSPYAYAGITVANFPNLFYLNGPCTGLGHNSILFNTECQVNYILDCIRKLSSTQHKAMVVKDCVYNEFIEWQTTNIKNTVFTTGCKAWYANKNGVIWTLWPRSTIEYWWMLYSCQMKDYVFY